MPQKSILTHETKISQGQLILLHAALSIFRTDVFVAPSKTIHNTHSNPASMTALVILFPAAFVIITELLASKLFAKVGIHRYSTANRDTQTSQTL